MRLIVSPKNNETGKFEILHGESSSSEYRAWSNAIYRCENKNAVQWDLYGGRGIKVCSEWRMSSDRFLKDMGQKPSPSHSLERMDVDGDYCPQNCKWATPAEQGNNRRNTRRIDGTPLVDIAKATGLPMTTVLTRFRRGWSLERLLSTPRREYSRGENVNS